MKRTILLVIGAYLSLALSGCSGKDVTTDGEQIVSLQDMAIGMSRESTIQPESAQEEAQTGDVPSETAVGTDSKESPRTAGDPAALNIHERNLDEIKEYLSRFSDTLEELSEEECYVILHGKEYSGREYLNAFLENVETEIPDELVFIQFTVEGDPIFVYLNYDGRDVYSVEDISRDAWAGNGEKYFENTYDSVWSSGEVDTEGNYYLSLYALQEQDMVIELFWATTDTLPVCGLPEEGNSAINLTEPAVSPADMPSFESNIQELPGVKQPDVQSKLPGIEEQPSDVAGTCIELHDLPEYAKPPAP